MKLKVSFLTMGRLISVVILRFLLPVMTTESRRVNLLVLKRDST